jgi:asparagine synthase (glutamine-hydrolysing)
LDQILALEQRFFLADHNLNYTDKMSMAAGVEVRVPFLDLDLVNFSTKIPDNLKQRGGTGKWVLKKAMEPYLPRDIIYRPKTGFGAPLRTWMQHDLKEIMRDLLSIESINSRGLFSAVNVQKLILDNNQGKVDASYTLFSLLCVEIWCREYLDKN